eukprot:COSAG06_NODE_33435_length_490_cov_0.511509_1_plen_111_part_10
MMQSSAEEGVPPAEAWVSEAALAAELSGMRIRALNARAEELGVPAHKLDEAEDESDTKSAIIDLILRAEKGLTDEQEPEDGPQEPEPEPEDAPQSEPEPEEPGYGLGSRTS